MVRPNRFKLTGDTHPPEVEFDLGGNLDEKEPVAATTASAQTEPGVEVTAVRVVRVEPFMPGTQDLLAEAGAQVRAKPFVTLAAAFALGFVLVKLFR